MTTMSIVYHSGNGHTAKMAEAVAKGASSVDGVEATLIAVDGRWIQPSTAAAVMVGLGHDEADDSRSRMRRSPPRWRATSSFIQTWPRTTRRDA